MTGHSLNSLLPFLLLSGCSSPTAPTARLKNADSPITCARGEALSYSLSPATGFRPNPSMIQLGRPLNWELQTPSATNNIRLDVCIDGETALLKRVVWQEGTMAPIKVAEGEGILSTSGLNAAVFGDSSSLELRIVEEYSRGLLIKGWTQEGNSFVTATPVGFSRDGSFEIHALSFPAGTLTLGNPFGTNPCPIGQQHVNSHFQLGSAKFEASVCTYLGGGETTGYDVLKLTVSDTNPALTETERAGITLEGDALKSALKLQWNHHNSCDSFVLKLPHATYAGTGLPVIACPTILDDAPVRPRQDQSRTILSRAKYHGGAWSEVKESESCNWFIPGCEG